MSLGAPRAAALLMAASDEALRTRVWRSRQSGFTIAELLVTLSIMAVVVAASIPAVLGVLDTYGRNGAMRQVLSDIRHAQSLAIERGATFAFEWGGSVGYAASQYRIIKDTSGACALPSITTAENGTTVVKGWTDLSLSYPDMWVQSMKDSSNVSVGRVMFNSRGASVNTCASVAFPITVTVVDKRGTTRQIEIRSAGNIVVR